MAVSTKIARRQDLTSFFGRRVIQSGLCFRTENRLRIDKLESCSSLFDWGQDKTFSLEEEGDSVGALFSDMDSAEKNR